MACDKAFGDVRHTALIVHGSVYELLGDTKKASRKFSGPSMRSFGGSGGFIIEGTINNFLKDSQESTVAFNFWQVASGQDLVKNRRQVTAAAQRYAREYPDYSAHHDNCHKFAMSLMNYCCRCLDQYDRNFIDGWCYIDDVYIDDNCQRLEETVSWQEEAKDHRHICFHIDRENVKDVCR